MKHQDYLRKGYRFLGWDIQKIGDGSFTSGGYTAKALYLGYSWRGKPKLIVDQGYFDWDMEGLCQSMIGYLSPPERKAPKEPPFTGFYLVGDEELPL